MDYKKEDMIRQFKRVIDDRSLDSMKNKLYEFFHLNCGFIAHYNIVGFKHEYSGHSFLRFLDQFTTPPYYLSYRDECGEIIREMCKYAKECEKQIRYEFENRTVNQKVNRLRMLAEELGYDIVPKDKGSNALPLSVSDNGQFTLF
ncbi:hypothetical protein [Bacillus sp. AFS040349]|uniref:hypothetical protein n=1 Tax=Bacillus sp. AFS040349 TaxID=2033502 RepID=UPI000BFC67A9|nr:hypothetical protein [Bacillus sp. AFS040349]PGT83258.1 hypothetical protein COD11_13060 [Bacillus sp. AFS040349]